MKTTILTFVMLASATPASATKLCDNLVYKQPPGTGNSLLTQPFPKGCRLTKGEQKTKEFCKTVPEGERGRGCWAYGLR